MHVDRYCNILYIYNMHRGVTLPFRDLTTDAKHYVFCINGMKNVYRDNLKLTHIQSQNDGVACS